MPVFGFLCFFLTSVFCFQFVCRYVLPRNNPSGCTCELWLDISCFLSLLGRRMLQWLSEDYVFSDVSCSSNELGLCFQQESVRGLSSLESPNKDCNLSFSQSWMLWTQIIYCALYAHYEGKRRETWLLRSTALKQDHSRSPFHKY